MVRVDGAAVRQLQRQCPELVDDAKIVAGMLWRYRQEFRITVTFDDLVELAVAEVWVVWQAAPQATQTERVTRAMQVVRRELRRTRAQLQLYQVELQSVEPTLLEQLAQRDLVRRLQSEWLPGDFADLQLLCDDSRTCKELAQQRVPHGTPREVDLEYMRLRKLKRRLLLRARATLDALDRG